MKLRKTRETLYVTRNKELANICYTPGAEVSERPPSAAYPEAGVLYVVTRRKGRLTK